MLRWLFPGRTADRLILRVTDLLDEFPGMSVWADGVAIDWLELIGQDEGFTQAAKDSAMYPVVVGYATRMIEERDGTAKPLSDDVVNRLEQAREDAPARSDADFQEVMADPTASDFDRELLQRLHDANADPPHNWEREVLDALVVDDDPESWFKGRRFLTLSGYGDAVWRVFLLKLTGVVNDQLTEERTFPWEAVQEFVRFGYVLRCGDALNGYNPALAAVG